MPVPNTFANATATIPLSQLDANFATTITLGNTAIQLGNTVTTLNNMTLANVTVTSGNVTITNVSVTTANVTTANIATAQIANVTVSGTGTFAAGSNTAPSITTAGDTNTGIFFPAADTIAFTEGGVESMRIDSSGNVGIGTSSPNGTLTINKVNLSNGTVFLNGATTGADFIRLKSTGSDGVLGIESSSGSNILSGSSANATVLYTVGATPLQFGTNSVVKTTLDSAGNLGLGVTPSAWGSGYTPLQGTGYSLYSGNAVQMQLSSNSYVNSGGSNAYRGTGLAALYQQSSGVHSWHYASSGTAGNTITFTQAMTLDASGNLGIGTASPAARLSVVGGNAQITGNGAAGYNTLFCQNDSTVQLSVGVSGSTAAGWTTNLAHLGTVSNSPLVFGTNNTERARITSGGSLLVGTTNTEPSANNVNGFAVDSTGWISVTGNTTAAIDCNRKTNDGTVIAIRQDGTIEGSISVAGNTVSYNPFLGSHAGAFADWSRPEVKIGTIFETINELIDYKVVAIEVEDVPKRISYNGNGAVGTTATVEYEGQEYTGIIENERGQERDFNKHVKVKINDTPDSKAVYGVFVGWNTDSSNDGGVYNDMLIGAVGNYVIRMAAGQTPEIGDLVKADGTGCAIVQEDDIVRTKTVGKITNTIPQLTYEDGSFLVACVLYCG